MEGTNRSHPSFFFSLLFSPFLDLTGAYTIERKRGKTAGVNTRVCEQGAHTQLFHSQSFQNNLRVVYVPLKLSYPSDSDFCVYVCVLLGLFVCNVMESLTTLFSRFLTPGSSSRRARHHHHRLTCCCCFSTGIVLFTRRPGGVIPRRRPSSAGPRPT